MATAMRVAASALGAAVLAAALCAPVAHAAATMKIGNYELANDRWNDHSWVWVITYSCNDGAPDCGTYLQDPLYAPHTDNLNVMAIPRPPKSQQFQGTAFFDNGRYTMTVDVPDGVRCIGYNLPSHDVYSWDAVTLAGTIDSSYDASCYGGPGGSSTYTFGLQRF